MDHSSDVKKKQLRKKLNKKRADKGLEELENLENLDDNSLFNMINQVNKSLKENPEMVKNISKCINNVFDNKDLMSSLINEVQTNIVNNAGSDSDSGDSDSGDSDSENIQEVGNMGPTGGIPYVSTILETSTEKELPDASENDSKQ
jgi:hypothetical protein